MKTRENLQELSDNIAKAIFAYRMAVEANLKESGKEYYVLGDDEESGLFVQTIGRHGVLNVYIDKVRYNNDTENVEAHVCEENGDEIDYWLNVSYFGEDEDYIYDNIGWVDLE